MTIKLDTAISSTKDGLYAYALQIDVVPANTGDSTDSTDSMDLPDPAWDGKVFVFRRSVPTMNPYGRTHRWVDDEFFNVATPVDMYDIPPDEPDPAHGMPYYRDSKVTLWFRNLEDAIRAKKAIQEDVDSLARLWDNMSNIPDREDMPMVDHSSPRLEWSRETLVCGE